MVRPGKRCPEAFGCCKIAGNLDYGDNECNQFQATDGYIRGTVEGTCATIKENGKAEPFIL